MAVRLAVMTVLIVALAAPARADPLLGSDLAAEALFLCRVAELVTVSEAEALLERGLAEAEQAIAADDLDAKAHFALFCNLGRRVQLRPIGLRSLTEMRRARRELDRTLELAPRSVDALAAKGALLLALPWFLGGDREEGERLLRQALEIDPEFAYARVTLARLREAREPS